MKQAAVSLLVSMACLAGCQGTTPTRPAASTAPKPTTATTDAFDLPKSVALSLPPALNIVASGAGNIIAQGAGNIVTNAGSNIVASGAGNAVGKNRQVLEAAQYPFLATLLPIYTRIYSASTRKIDLAIAALRKAGLKDGMVVTFTDDDPVKELATVTVKLQRVGKQAVVQVCFGPTFDDTKLGGVAVFTDAKHGRLLVHPPVPEVKALLLATTFDHELHKASADGLVDGSLVTGNVGPAENAAIPVVASAERYHYEFRELDPAANKGASFTMAVSAFRTYADKPQFNGGYALTTNFLPDGGVAAVGGMKTEATGPNFVWFSGLALPVPDASQPHSLFAGLEGGKLVDLTRESATAAMQGIVPPDTGVGASFPPSPLTTDLEADATFALPTATP